MDKKTSFILVLLLVLALGGTAYPLADLYDDGESFRSFSPQTVTEGQPGQSFEIHCRVRNGGTANANAFYVKFFASTDTSITFSDNYIGFRWTSEIPAGVSHEMAWHLDFPINIPAGDYWVGWIIDADSNVAESDETNNTAHKEGYKLTVLPENRPPVAGDDAYTTPVETTLTVSAPGVLVNDTDPHGDPLTAVEVSGPSHGTLSLNPNGSFSYTPNGGFSGTDTFTYRADDGRGGTDTATATIYVYTTGRPPVASDDAYSTAQDTTLTVPAPGVLGNDSDPDGDPLVGASLLSDPSNGTLTLNQDGSFSYTPNAGFSGPDRFYYRAYDGFLLSDIATVTITVGAGNHPPVANDDAYSTAEDTTLTVPAPGVLGNDTDPDGDPLTAAPVSGPSHGTLSLNLNGSFTYNPNTGFSGTDTFTYRDDDGQGGTDTATVTITVSAGVNHAPVANDDAYSTAEDTTLTVPAPGVLANDTDPDGDPLTAAAWSGPSHGTLMTLHPDGSFTYTPDAGFIGTDTFTYVADDGQGGTDAATVTIHVSSGNHVPVANDDAYSTGEGTTLTVPAPGVLTNDTDPDGDPLTATLDSGPSHGTLSLNPDGSFGYTPNAGFLGTDTFTYCAEDDHGGIATATVVITVQSPHVEVPDVVGKSLYAAQSAITSAGFVVGTTSANYSDTVPAGYVISQDPAAGTEVLTGSAVDLVISLGPQDGPGEAQACCFADGSCEDLTPEECLAAGGMPQGAGTTCATTDCSQPPVGGVVAHYKLDEGSGTTAADASGNGHHGTAQNGAPTWVDGQPGYGKAIHFDGTTACAWVDCGTWNPSAATGQLTVALWVKWNGPNGEFQGLIAKSDSWDEQGTEMMWMLEISKDNHDVFFERAGSYPPCGGIVLPQGQWSHVAATFDGSTLIFYVDGAETGRGDFSFGAKTDATIVFGAAYKAGWIRFNGALDDIRLYDHALSESEVRAAMLPLVAQPQACCFADGSCQDLTAEDCLAQGGTAQGEGTTCATSTCPGPVVGGLVAHWPLDETTGNVAYDDAGSHDAVLYGNPIWQPTGGIISGALEFDGIDDYVGVGSIGTYDVLSIGSWVNVDSLAQTYNSLFHNDGWAESDVHFMILDNGQIRFSVSGNNAPDRDSDFAFAPDLFGEWHHVAVVYDSSVQAVDFYIDGQHDVQRLYNSAGSAVVGPLRIGGWDGSSRFFDGAMDDVRIYDIALSEAEVAALCEGVVEPAKCLQYPEMDFNKDCRVDFLDLARFLQNWLECNLDRPDECWK